MNRGACRPFQGPIRFYLRLGIALAWRIALACASLAVPLGDGLAAGMHTGIGKEPGSQLLELCQAATPAPGGPDSAGATSQRDARACLAFIDGFAWGHAWASWRESRDMWFCLPEGFSSEQGARDVVRYLQLHPDRLDEESHLLVFLALTAAYHCTP
jgi:hypothetical protein